MKLSRDSLMNTDDASFHCTRHCRNPLWPLASLSFITFQLLAAVDVVVAARSRPLPNKLHTHTHNKRFNSLAPMVVAVWQPCFTNRHNEIHFRLSMLPTLPTLPTSPLGIWAETKDAERGPSFWKWSLTLQQWPSITQCNKDTVAMETTSPSTRFDCNQLNICRHPNSSDQLWSRLESWLIIWWNCYERVGVGWDVMELMRINERRGRRDFCRCYKV